MNTELYIFKHYPLLHILHSLTRRNGIQITLNKYDLKYPFNSNLKCGVYYTTEKHVLNSSAENLVMNVHSAAECTIQRDK